MRDNRQAALEGEIAELRAQLEACRAELTEARAQQTATGEVLQLINSSPGDLAPVFDAIVEKAHALCDATQGSLQLWDGEMFRGVAMRGFPEDMVRALRRGYSPGPNHPCRLLLDGERVVHCADMAEVDDPVTRQGAKLSGIRTVLYLALRKDTVLLGQIVAGRQQVRPFAAKEIALVENFAAQAVIAMENARLLGELRQRTHDLEEALEYQTAISDVLRVISGSVFELERVLKTVVSTAIRLCRADEAVIFRNIEGEYRWAAGNSLAPEYEVIEREVRIRPGTGTLVGRTALQGRTVHILDAWSDPLYEAKDDARIGGIHTMLGVPLMRDGQPIGVIGLARRRIEAYTDKEIGLVRTFADQAVIAIENARLLTETREALEQQTATAEVLQVINSSPGDLAPVFDAMLDKATRLCQAPYGQLVVYDGEFFRFVAVHGETYYAEQQRRDPVLPSFGVTWQRIVRGAAIVHIADVLEDDGYQAAPPSSRALVDASGMRTLLTVALRKDDVLLGTLTVYRQEVRPFSEKEIALVENFAAQAVIAMENARLLTETREALQQQTATAEVLQVINSSPGNLAPVFDAILEKAHALCGADHGHLTVYEGGQFRALATHGVPAAFEKLLRQPFRPGLDVTRRLRAGESVIQFTDMAALSYDPDDRIGRGAAGLAGARTLLIVTLRKDDALLGYITAHRKEVRAFSEKEIALLQNFAAQAVIAIENARLLTETREALEQQTAIAEVLQVINSSPGNLAPVFEAILERAHSLCAAPCGSLQVFDREWLRAVATRGMPEPFAAMLREGFRPLPGTVNSLDPRQVDMELAARSNPDERVTRAGVDVAKLRTTLFVPLHKDNVFLGRIVAARQELRPFSDKQIALLQNFAAQAVIAMENARLLTETREALEQQTATAEVLQVINSSPGDLQPVFDAILEKALNLCGAAFGVLWHYEGGLLHATAIRGATPEYADFLSGGAYEPAPVSAHGRLLAGADVVHIADVADHEDYRSGNPTPRALVDLGGGRTLLAVPLRKDDAFLGDMMIYRREVRPFADKQIALLQNFAAQAVIAMDNARLLQEIRQRQAELRVTFDNMGDGVAMFDAELRLAAWNRNFQEILDLPDRFVAERPKFAEYFRYLAGRGEYASTDLEAELRGRLDDPEREMRFERARPDGRVVEVRRNPVPGGGFVMIYSDVTARKRAEGEIRTARDAAEKALAELKTTQASLIHAEKMASLGQLTAGIAHEIKNPLNFVNNFAGLSVELLDELKAAAGPGIAALDPDTRAEIDETIQMLTGNLDKITEHGRRADGIVQSMLLHSRGGSGERQRVDLNALVHEALNLAYHGARAQDQDFNITLERDFAASMPLVELVPQDMMRVFINLISNGFHAARQRLKDAHGSGFRPLLKVATRDLGDAVEIRVRDNGIGIAPEHRDKLFQPFFTTKPSGEGTGLGLSISYDIVAQQHGGTISVDSEPGVFTEFTVRLPRR